MQERPKTPYLIPLPPQRVSREALAIALYVFIAVLKRSETDEPDSKVALALIQAFGGLASLPHHDGMVSPRPIAEISREQIEQTARYLSQLYESPEMEFLTVDSGDVH